ncbi:Erythritol kinase [bacterium YEK0313]|nr:Erythritol kinase [bacterium YEK0313]
MTGAILCLDSGTTVVKAALFSADGHLVALEEAPNTALRRASLHVEQDMAATAAIAMSLLARLAQRLGGHRPGVLVVTGQGDGLWPVDAAGRPAGPAMTWLDGRAAELLPELEAAGVLDRIRQVTLSQPTAASQPLQLLWLARREPARFAAVHRALRCKEWLQLALTGTALTDPSAVLPSWGDWRRQMLSREVETCLGLARGIDLLPDMVAMADAARPLSPAAAAATGLPAGLPVLLGPGDAQASALGLGIGLLPGIARVSLFGTSAIHIRHLADLADVQAEPPGAMLLPFAEPGQFLRLMPSLNGAAALAHLAPLVGDMQAAPYRPSGLLVQSFFEPVGERAPVTSPHARSTVFGWAAGEEPAALAAAAREGLAFAARMSHDLMGLEPGPVVLGGGLAADADFARIMAATLGRPVLRPPARHASLTGLGLVGMRHLAGGRLADHAGRWLGGKPVVDAPDEGPFGTYLARKYVLYASLMERIAPLWPDLAAVADLAARLSHPPTPSKN